MFTVTVWVGALRLGMRRGERDRERDRERKRVGEREERHGG